MKNVGHVPTFFLEKFMHFIKTDLTVSGNLTFLGNISGELPNPKISENANNTLIQELDGLFVPDMNPKISSTSGNTLISNEDGLYVPTPTQISYTNGSGLSLVGTEFSTKISNTAGNTLSVDVNGLYVPTPTTYTSGNGITLSGNVINTKISLTAGNIISINSDGLYVPTPTPYISGSGINISSNTISTKISSTSGNTLSIDANGLYVPTPTPYTAGNGISISSNVVTAKVSNVAGNSITVDSNGLYSPQISNDYLWVRDKTEVYYTSAFTVTSTPTSLISLLKVLTPSSGTLNKFFNTTSNKLNVYNENSTVFFKLSLTGEWQTGTANLGMQLNFVSTNGNNLNTTRNPAATTDIITFTVFFSVDKNGNLVSNGTDMLIKTFSSSFNVSSALIIAEQMIHPGSVLSVK